MSVHERAGTFTPVTQKNETTQGQVRKINLFRAMADTLFIRADEMERWHVGCLASGNPDGAATWRNLANHTRNEAHEYVRRADLMKEQAQ